MFGWLKNSAVQVEEFHQFRGTFLFRVAGCFSLAAFYLACLLYICLLGRLYVVDGEIVAIFGA